MKDIISLSEVHNRQFEEKDIVETTIRSNIGANILALLYLSVCNVIPNFNYFAGNLNDFANQITAGHLLFVDDLFITQELKVAKPQKNVDLINADLNKKKEDLKLKIYNFFELFPGHKGFAKRAAKNPEKITLAETLYTNLNNILSKSLNQLDLLGSNSENSCVSIADIQATTIYAAMLAYSNLAENICIKLLNQSSQVGLLRSDLSPRADDQLNLKRCLFLLLSQANWYSSIIQDLVPKKPKVQVLQKFGTLILNNASNQSFQLGHSSKFNVIYEEIAKKYSTSEITVDGYYNDLISMIAAQITRTFNPQLEAYPNYHSGNSQENVVRENIIKIADVAMSGVLLMPASALAKENFQMDPYDLSAKGNPSIRNF